MNLDIEFRDELPAAKRRGPSERTLNFASALRDNPMRWAKYPTRAKSNDSSRSIASSIGAGRLTAFLPAGAFEARHRDGEIWVRYIGGAA